MLSLDKEPFFSFLVSILKIASELTDLDCIIERRTVNLAVFDTLLTRPATSAIDFDSSILCDTPTLASTIPVLQILSWKLQSSRGRKKGREATEVDGSSK